MARYTSDDAVKKYGASRFEMILAAAQRARELSRGSRPLVDGKDATTVVTALREIEEGKYTRKDFLDKIETRKKHEYYPT